MRTLRLLGLLALLCPQLARAQAAPAETPATPAAPAATAPAKPSAPKPAKPAKAAPTKPAAEAEAAQTAPAPAPVAPAAPPGAFPQAPPPPPDTAEAPPAPLQGQGYPYGYGYGYVAPPMDPRHQKALHDLQQLDLRIASLRKQQRQYSIVGPAIMTGSGYLVAFGFGVAALASYFIAEDIREGDCPLRFNRSTREYDDRCDVNNNGLVTGKDEDAARTLARTFGAISALGAGVGVVGTVLLVKQLAKRRQYQPELYELNTQRGQLIQQLRWGGGYSSNGATLTLSGKF